MSLIDTSPPTASHSTPWTPLRTGGFCPPDTPDLEILPAAVAQARAEIDEGPVVSPNALAATHLSCLLDVLQSVDQTLG